MLLLLDARWVVLAEGRVGLGAQPSDPVVQQHHTAPTDATSQRMDYFVR
jgi:hypothetical protein